MAKHFEITDRHRPPRSIESDYDLADGDELTVADDVPGRRPVAVAAGDRRARGSTTATAAALRCAFDLRCRPPDIREQGLFGCKAKSRCRRARKAPAATKVADARRRQTVARRVVAGIRGG